MKLRRVCDRQCTQFHPPCLPTLLDFSVTCTCLKAWSRFCGRQFSFQAITGIDAFLASNEISQDSSSMDPKSKSLAHLSDNSFSMPSLDISMGGDSLGKRTSKLNVTRIYPFG